jgi:hypothetical protein
MNSFNDYSIRVSRSFFGEVIGYIARCHLEDGGYFFARVLPSSATDTYYAVKSLLILGVKPDRPQDIAAFFLNQFKEGSLNYITNLFTASEVLNELGLTTDGFEHFAYQRILSFQNTAGGFGTTENIDVEVASELMGTYRAVKILGHFGRGFNKEKVERFVFNLLNQDGGYGRNSHSTLASTFYATAIHKLLGTDINRLANTKAYLKRREENWQVQFIEDIYWLVLGLANLYEKSSVPAKVIRFVKECQRATGGFSRATVMGIPTLEYTYYALSILKEVEAI